MRKSNKKNSLFNKIEKFQKNSKSAGITLLALVVTIIILLILAGVAVGFATNGTGLFDKAKFATDKYNNSVEEEQSEINKYNDNINSIISGTREEDYSYELDTSNSVDLGSSSIYSNNSNNYYKAPTDGYICAIADGKDTNNYAAVLIVDKSGNIVGGVTADKSGAIWRNTSFVKKGTLLCGYNLGTGSSARFIPLKKE